MSITNITPQELKLQAEVAELDEKLEYMTLAFSEWIEKTQWVQDTIQPGELGMHRADVIKSRFDAIKAKLAEYEKQEQEPVAYMLTTRNFGLGGETWDTTEYRDYPWDSDCVPLYTKGTP